MEKLAVAGYEMPDGLCIPAQPLFLIIREWR